MTASLARLLPACCLIGALGAAPQGLAGEDALQAIERMNRALRDLNYEGEFVFQQGQRLESMRITHRNLQGEEHEHLVVLDGEKREVIRSRDTVTCLAPGGSRAKLNRRVAGLSFSPLLQMNTELIDRHYQLGMSGTSRTAGRTTRIIDIVPRDALRYGYQLHLDAETYLPLRSRMLDEDGRPLSEMLFTDLRLLQDEGAMPQLPEIAATASTAADRSETNLHRLMPPAWQFTGLPSGFMLDVHRRRASDVAHGPMEHFVFSDGLATVSVYIEALAQTAFEGVSTVGTLTALGRRIGDHQITVVGEVPLKTLHQLAQAVEPVADNP